MYKFLHSSGLCVDRRAKTTAHKHHLAALLPHAAAVLQLFAGIDHRHRRRRLSSSIDRINSPIAAWWNR